MANELPLFSRLDLPGLLWPSDTRPKEITAVAYAPSDPTQCWVGTSQGQLFRSTTSAQGLWTRVPVTGLGPNVLITRIAVDPNDARTLAIAGALAPPADPSQRPEPGPVYLSRSGGNTFSEVSQRVRAGGDFTRGVGLPPCSITALCFDPDETKLYAAGLGGVYVLDYGATTPRWSLIPGVPPVWITDLSARPDRKLLCATYGRGLFELDLGSTPPLPAEQLYIRQHVVERGDRYPRVYSFTGLEGQNLLAQDPRGGGQPLSLDLAVAASLQAFDLRVTPEPLAARDTRLDPAAFDVELRHLPARLGRANQVHVQVHNRGTGTAQVDVHLYVARYSALSPPRLPNGFFATLGQPPPTGDFALVGTQSVPVPANADLVVPPFAWNPEATLAPEALLLVLASSSGDPVSEPTPDPTDVGALLRSERRAAGRVVQLQGDLYIRSGVDDTGDTPALALLARSPDILVSSSSLADAEAMTRFSDLTEPLPGDELAANNFVRIRVHNPSNVPIAAKVRLYAVPEAQLSEWPLHPLGGELTVTSSASPGSGTGINPKEWALSAEVPLNLGTPPTPQVIIATISGVLNPGATEAVVDPYPELPTDILRGAPAYLADYLLRRAARNIAVRALAVSQ